MERSKNRVCGFWHWNLALIFDVWTWANCLTSLCLSFFICERALCMCSILPESLQSHRLKPARLLCPWNFPDKKTGMGYKCLLRVCSELDTQTLLCSRLQGHSWEWNRKVWDPREPLLVEDARDKQAEQIKQRVCWIVIRLKRETTQERRFRRRGEY